MIAQPDALYSCLTYYNYTGPEATTPDISKVGQNEKENWSPKSVETVIHTPSAKSRDESKGLKVEEMDGVEVVDVPTVGVRRSATWEDFRTVGEKEGCLKGGGEEGGRKGLRAASFGI